MGGICSNSFRFTWGRDGTLAKIAVAIAKFRYRYTWNEGVSSLAIHCRAPLRAA